MWRMDFPSIVSSSNSRSWLSLLQWSGSCIEIVHCRDGEWTPNSPGAAREPYTLLHCQQHRPCWTETWVWSLEPVPVKVDGKITVKFGGSRWGLFTLPYSRFPGLLSILYNKCKLDTLERSIFRLPGVPDCWWTSGCTNSKDFLVVQCAASGSLKARKMCYYYQNQSKSKTHRSSKNIKNFKKVLGKGRGKEHAMVLHSTHVR